MAGMPADASSTSSGQASRSRAVRYLLDLVYRANDDIITITVVSGVLGGNLAARHPDLRHRQPPG